MGNAMNREHFLVFFIVLAFGAAFGCGEESGGEAPVPSSDAGIADAQAAGDMNVIR